MNIVVKSALAGAVVVVAHACATPVEIADDVLPVDPSTFGDGGLPPAGAGGGGGGGASGTAQSGTGAATGGSGVAAGGTAGGVGAGVGGASAGSGMQAAAGASTLPVGTGGTATGVGGATAQGGVGGAAGSPATAGTGGTPAAAGTTGTGETGVFDAASCDFDDLTGCEDLACLAACPTNDGGSCSTRCQTLITCVTTDPECTITEADPLCATRIGGAAAACTAEADSAGGATTTQTTAPSFVARRLVECICSVPRP
jgi:hypothetical protein